MAGLYDVVGFGRGRMNDMLLDEPKQVNSRIEAEAFKLDNLYGSAVMGAGIGLLDYFLDRKPMNAVYIAIGVFAVDAIRNNYFRPSI